MAPARLCNSPTQAAPEARHALPSAQGEHEGERGEGKRAHAAHLVGEHAEASPRGRDGAGVLAGEERGYEEAGDLLVRGGAPPIR